MDATAREVPRGRQRFREVHRNLKAEVRSFPLHVVGGDVQIASAVCEVILKVYRGRSHASSRLSACFHSSRYLGNSPKVSVIEQI
jgi:hypothetical protein